MIYFFSRIGRSEFVVNKLSKRRNDRVFKIEDHHDSSGFSKGLGVNIMRSLESVSRLIMENQNHGCGHFLWKFIEEA